MAKRATVPLSDDRYIEILMRRNPLSHLLKPYYRPFAVASVLAVAGLGACSSVPDEANPVKWYEGVTSLIEDDDEIFGSDNGPIEPAPGGDDPFPNLASVPDGPRPTTSSEDLDELTEGLIADRRNAQYTDEVLRSRYADEGTRSREDALVSATPEPTSPAVPPEKPREPIDVPTPEVTVVAAEDYTPAPTASGSIEAASAAVLQARARVEDAPPRRVTGERQVAVQRVEIPKQTAVASEQRVETPKPTVVTEERRAESTEQQVAAVVRQPVAAPQPEAAPQKVARATPPANTGRAPSPRGIQPLTLAGFKSLFNERFEASGRPPTAIPVGYRPDERTAGANQSNGLIQDGDPFLGLADLTIPDASLAGNAVSFQAANIRFGSGGAGLSNTARGKLREVVALHKQYGGFVKVVGHSSRRTGAMNHDRHQLINFKLSVDRAQAVAVELQRLGVASSALIISAAGDNQPIAHEYMPDGEAANRRAEIFIQY